MVINYKEVLLKYKTKDTQRKYLTQRQRGIMEKLEKWYNKEYREVVGVR